jgi:hypothetical protein
MKFTENDVELLLCCMSCYHKKIKLNGRNLDRQAINHQVILAW